MGRQSILCCREQMWVAFRVTACEEGESLPLKWGEKALACWGCIEGSKRQGVPWYVPIGESMSCSVGPKLASFARGVLTLEPSAGLGLLTCHSMPAFSPLFAWQCRMVKITIRGDEGVPVQVDGEAWIQPPGIIKIQHKNRAQMLTRDRVRPRCSSPWEHSAPERILVSHTLYCLVL